MGGQLKGPKRSISWARGSPGHTNLITWLQSPQIASNIYSLPPFTLDGDLRLSKMWSSQVLLFDWKSLRFGLVWVVRLLWILVTCCSMRGDQLLIVKWIQLTTFQLTANQGETTPFSESLREVEKAFVCLIFNLDAQQKVFGYGFPPLRWLFSALYWF